MSTIYSLSSWDSNKITLEKVWDKSQSSELSSKYTAMTSLRVGKDIILIAYSKTDQKTDAYRLLDSDPWIEKIDSKIDLSDTEWDLMKTFVLGNDNFLMMYEKKYGTFGFYQIENDLTSSSKPYKFSNSRATPTNGFTTIAPIVSLGEQYFLGYDIDSGKVASFSLSVKTTSWKSPPLRATNIWFHQWSPGWTHFAFFQLGEANFFFKINKNRLNVNIDHILDDPAKGGVPIGSHLERELPDAESISHTTMLPWENDEPNLLTHIDESALTTIYRINADCRSFTDLGQTSTKKNTSIIVSYQVGKKTFALFYGEED